MRELPQYRAVTLPFVDILGTLEHASTRQQNNFPFDTSNQPCGSRPRLRRDTATTAIASKR